MIKPFRIFVAMLLLLVMLAARILPSVHILIQHCKPLADTNVSIQDLNNEEQEENTKKQQADFVADLCYEPVLKNKQPRGYSNFRCIDLPVITQSITTPPPQL